MRSSGLQSLSARNQSWKRCIRARSKARVQFPFHRGVESLVAPGWLYVVHYYLVRGVYMAAGHVGKCRGCEGPCEPGAKGNTPRGKRKNAFVWGLMCLKSSLCIATPPLANDLFPGATGGQVRSLCHPGLTGHVRSCSFREELHRWQCLCSFQSLISGLLTMASPLPRHHVRRPVPCSFPFKKRGIHDFVGLLERGKDEMLTLEFFIRTAHPWWGSGGFNLPQAF